jgi:hypothetical protein
VAARPQRLLHALQNSSATLAGWKGKPTLNDAAARSIWFHSCNSWSLSKGRSRGDQRMIARRSSKKLRRQSSTLEVSATACYWPRAMGKTLSLFRLSVLYLTLPQQYHWSGSSYAQWHGPSKHTCAHLRLVIFWLHRSFL